MSTENNNDNNKLT